MRGIPAHTTSGSPTKSIPIGMTDKTQHDFESFLRSIRKQFTARTYKLLENNCNHFSNECCKFLCNIGIPEEIISLPALFLATPMGKQLEPMINKFYGGGDPLRLVSGDVEKERENRKEKGVVFLFEKEEAEDELNEKESHKTAENVSKESDTKSCQSSEQGQPQNTQAGGFNIPPFAFQLLQGFMAQQNRPQQGSSSSSPSSAPSTAQHQHQNQTENGTHESSEKPSSSATASQSERKEEAKTDAMPNLLNMLGQLKAAGADKILGQYFPSNAVQSVLGGLLSSTAQPESAKQQTDNSHTADEEDLSSHPLFWTSADINRILSTLFDNADVFGSEAGSGKDASSAAESSASPSSSSSSSSSSSIPSDSSQNGVLSLSDRQFLSSAEIKSVFTSLLSHCAQNRVQKEASESSYPHFPERVHQILNSLFIAWPLNLTKPILELAAALALHPAEVAMLCVESSKTAAKGEEESEGKMMSESGLTGDSKEHMTNASSLHKSLNLSYLIDMLLSAKEKQTSVFNKLLLPCGQNLANATATSSGVEYLKRIGKVAEVFGLATEMLRIAVNSDESVLSVPSSFAIPVSVGASLIHNICLRLSADEKQSFDELNSEALNMLCTSLSKAWELHRMAAKGEGAGADEEANERALRTSVCAVHSLLKGNDTALAVAMTLPDEISLISVLSNIESSASDPVVSNVAHNLSVMMDI